MAVFESQLEWAKWFKAEFGICPAQLKKELSEQERKNQADFDDLILKVTGYPNGHHPDAAHDIHINWAKIAECEAEGYDWPTMPYLPAPCERIGKTDRELNWMAYNRREQLRQSK